MPMIRRSIALFLAANAASALAADYSWINEAGGFWDDPANWSSTPSAPGTVPGGNDAVTISTLSGATVTLRQEPGAPASPFTQYVAGSLTVNTPFEITGGNLQVTGDATFNESFAWVAGGLHLFVTSPGGTWTFKKGIHYTNAFLGGMNATAAVLQGTSVLDGAQGILWNANTTLESGAALEMRNGDRALFNNRLDIDGTFDRTGGAAEATLSYSTGRNAGVVRNRVGTLIVQQRSQDQFEAHTGEFVVDSGASLRFQGTHTFEGVIRGDGDVELDGFTDFVIDATRYEAAGVLKLSRGAKLTWQGDGTVASLDGAAGNLALQGTMDVTGVSSMGLTIVTGAQGSLIRFKSGMNASFGYVHNVAGTTELGGTSTFGSGAGLSGGPGATLHVLEGGSVLLEGSGSSVGGAALFNEGTFVKRGSQTSHELALEVSNEGTFKVEAGTLVSNPIVAFTNAGTVDVAEGAMLDRNGGTYVQTAGTTHVDGQFLADEFRFEGGTVTGSGVLRNNADETKVFLDGTLSPGNSPGMFTIQGDLDMGDNAVLDVEIGPDSDLLVVNGHVSFAGVLRFRLAPGYVPTGPGPAFGVVLFDTADGSIAIEPAGDAALPQYRFQLLTEAHLVSVQVVAVPEPAEWAMLLAGAGLVGSMVRSRRRA